MIILPGDVVTQVAIIRYHSAIPVIYAFVFLTSDGVIGMFIYIVNIKCTFITFVVMALCRVIHADKMKAT